MERAMAGIIGIAIALFALTATVLAETVLPNPPLEPENKLKIQFGKLNLGWSPKPAEPPAELIAQRTFHQRVHLAGIILAIIALPIAVVSWARHERVWWGLGIVIFAIAALAWQYFVVVFALLLFSGAIFLFVPTERPSAT